MLRVVECAGAGMAMLLGGEGCRLGGAGDWACVGEGKEGDGEGGREEGAGKKGPECG